MGEKILIIEDEKPIADIMKYNLDKEGFVVDIAQDGEEGVKRALEDIPDLILLDIMLPKMDGFQVCKAIRAKLNTPIIMVTAKEEEVDKVLGLELGADDYITKPFSNRELMARVKSNLRRVSMDGGNSEQKTIESGTLKIDLNKYEVTKGLETIDLTFREFELLKHLACQPSMVFTRENLLGDVWGYEYYGDIRTVDVTVRRLREKIEDDPGQPKYVMTKRGVGYYFKK